MRLPVLDAWALDRFMSQPAATTTVSKGRRSLRLRIIGKHLLSVHSRATRRYPPPSASRSVLHPLVHDEQLISQHCTLDELTVNGVVHVRHCRYWAFETDLSASVRIDPVLADVA